MIRTISELLPATQNKGISCASSHILFQNNVCVVRPFNYFNLIVFILDIDIAVSLGRPISLYSCRYE